METLDPIAETQATEPKASKPSAQPFDFRHPSFLSSGEWRKLRIELDEFVESLGALLSTYFRLDFGLQIGKLHTLPFNEFTSGLPQATHLALFKQEPLRGIAVFEIRPQIGLTMVDRLLGGPGKPPAATRSLTEMEIALLDQVVQIVLTEWAKQWRKFQELRPEILGHENNPKFLQTSSGDTTMLVINLQGRIGTLVEEMQLAFPYNTLEPLVKKLTESVPSPSVPNNPTPAPAPAVKWNRNLDNVSIGVTARWPAVKITTRQLLALKPGEILELSPELAEKIELRIGQITKFKGRLGTHQNKWAIQITDLVKSA